MFGVFLFRLEFCFTSNSFFNYCHGFSLGSIAVTTIRFILSLLLIVPFLKHHLIHSSSKQFCCYFYCSFSNRFFVYTEKKKWCIVVGFFSFKFCCCYSTIFVCSTFIESVFLYSSTLLISFLCLMSR